MFEVGKIYSRKQYEKGIKNTVFGIQKDVLKDKYAPDIEYADFFLGESKDGKYVYCVKTTSKGSIFGKRNIKILGIISREEYNRI